MVIDAIYFALVATVHVWLSLQQCMASKRKLEDDMEITSKRHVLNQVSAGFTSDKSTSTLLAQMSKVTKINSLNVHRTSIGKVALTTYT